MLNQMQIKDVAEETNTSKLVFNHLKKRIRFRRETNLSKLHNILMNSGAKVIDEEYINTFKRLQEAGAGSLIIGRHGKPDRFKWYYNLKHVADVANGSVSDIKKLNDPTVKVVKRGPGRPKKVQTATNEPINLVVKIPANSDPAKISKILQLAAELIK